jgi:hypothetical protein
LLIAFSNQIHPLFVFVSCVAGFLFPTSSLFQVIFSVYRFFFIHVFFARSSTRAEGILPGHLTWRALAWRRHWSYVPEHFTYSAIGFYTRQTQNNNNYIIIIIGNIEKKKNCH